MDPVQAIIEFHDAAREYAKIESTDYRNTHKPDEIMKRRSLARGRFLDTYKNMISLEKGDEKLSS